jgi:non-ribosomal peptide synthase protein (TIGR01720 family)
VLPAGSVDARGLLRRVDIGGVSGTEFAGLIGSQARASELGLSLSDGVVVQAVWFDAGASAAGRLLLTIHHFAVDGVSWRILVPDLAAAWGAVLRGEVPVLSERSSSLRRWSQRLVVEAQSEERVRELGYWTGVLGGESVVLSAGALDVDRDVAGSAGHVTLELGPEVTGLLLTRVVGAFHGGINDVLLACLGLSVVDWSRRRGGGGSSVLVDLEGHGREEIFSDIDLSRTVGWFTSLHPVRLELGGIDVSEALSGGAALGICVKAVKEQLRGVVDHGLGYGLLRYLNAAGRSALSRYGGPQLSFNYLGRLAGPSETDWGSAAEGSLLGPGGDPLRPLGHCVSVDAYTLDGASGPVLTAHWSWAPALLGAEAVEDLARGWFAALSALARHAEQPGAGGRTPSDVGLAGLSQGEIERLERAYAH